MKASKRRERAKRISKSTPAAQPAAVQETAFSAAEEAFFREGTELSIGSTVTAAESLAELDAPAAAPARPSLWQRWFAREHRRAAAPAWRTEQTC